MVRFFCLNKYICSKCIPPAIHSLMQEKPLTVIDVIVPSFRMEEQILLGIFKLKQPVGFKVNYLLVCDNPFVKIPPAIHSLAEEGKINLIINEVNRGSSFTRNRGIVSSKGDWMLFLDDDIVPSPDLLITYSEALQVNPDVIGFVGLTQFPEPFNMVTNALMLNGSMAHFHMSKVKNEQPWAPTANLMLNRRLLGALRFREELNSGGEDVELLVRFSQKNGMLYKSLAKAVVYHPWWDNGGSQMKRMFRYGHGNATILKLPHIWKFSHLDFSNTIESVFLVILLLPVCLAMGLSLQIPLKLLLAVLLAELLTNTIRSIKAAKKFSPALIWQMILHKNAQEVGFFWALLKSGRWLSMCRAIDFGFKKPHPSPFRLNRWKIVKLVIVLLLLSLLRSY